MKIVAKIMTCLFLFSALSTPMNLYAQNVETAGHKTYAWITDITDPENPKQIAYQEGNLLGSCGVKNLFNLGIGGVGTSMGDSTSMGCGGTNEFSQQKVACLFNADSNITVGSISAAIASGGCLSAGSLFNCCTGSGSGCTISHHDVLTFSEGQPNESISGIGAIWNPITVTPPSEASGGYAPAARRTVSAAPTLIYNGSDLMGVRFVASFNGNDTLFDWCEYAVRSDGDTGSSTACGPVANSSSGLSPGWQINHAYIDPCTGVKPSGSTWQITVEIWLT